MSDAVEALWQDVEQESAQSLSQLARQALPQPRALRLQLLERFAFVARGPDVSNHARCSQEARENPAQCSKVRFGQSGDSKAPDTKADPNNGEGDPLRG
jgi:hypothetical protein